MESDLRVLLIDAPSAEPLLREITSSLGPSFEAVTVVDEPSLAGALEAPWDLVLVESQPRFSSGAELVELVRERHPNVPLLVYSSAIGDRMAVELMRRGASDFAWKDDPGRFPEVVTGLLRNSDARRARARLDSQLGRLGRMYRVLFDVSQAIIRVADPPELLAAVCRLGAQIGPYERVRVTRNQDRILMTLADVGQGNAPPFFWEKHILANGRPLVNNDLSLGGEAGFGPWAAAALYPLSVGGTVWGCLAFYSLTKDAFGPDVTPGLLDLAEDLGRGLEHRAREVRWRETDQFLSDMANLVPGVFYKTRYAPATGTQFQYVSPGIDLLLPLSSDQAVADASKVFRTLHPADRQRFRLAAIRSRNFLTVFNLEFRLLRPNGTVVWVLATAFPQKQEDESVIWTGLAIEVTPQHKLQEALQREQELLSVILNNIGDGVIAVDERDELVLVNQTACRLLDASVPLGSPWRVLDPALPWDATDRFHSWLRRRLDGSVLHLEVRVSDLVTEGMGFRGRVMLLRDMTDRDLIEERLRQSEKLESIGLLAGGIAHDFNNLMTGVFGFIQLARMNSEEPSRVVGYLDHALGPFQRARTLTQHLLTFARGGEPSRVPVRLGSVLPAVLEFSLAGSPVTWELLDPEPAWSVLANEAQLHQVFENLLLNAKQAMPTGGAVRVKLANIPAPGPEGRGLDVGPYVEILVTDNGPGMNPEVQAKAFDPFFTTKASGTGLGLSICFSVVKKHLGAIELESNPGRGSSFRVFWPAVVVTPEAGEA